LSSTPSPEPSRDGREELFAKPPESLFEFLLGLLLAFLESIPLLSEALHEGYLSDDRLNAGNHHGSDLRDAPSPTGPHGL
jgi:hypothetical protein